MSLFRTLLRRATDLDQRNTAALISAKSFIEPGRHPIKGEIEGKENCGERPSRCSSLQSACSVANVETLGRILHIRPAGNFQMASLPRGEGGVGQKRRKSAGIGKAAARESMRVEGV